MQDRIYLVQWVKDGLVVTEDRFDDLRDAKAHAMRQIKLYRALEIATLGLVCDVDGEEYMRIY